MLKNHKLFLFDMDGTIYIGNKLFDFSVKGHFYIHSLESLSEGSNHSVGDFFNFR